MQRETVNMEAGRHLTMELRWGRSPYNSLNKVLQQKVLHVKHGITHKTYTRMGSFDAYDEGQGETIEEVWEDIL